MNKFFAVLALLSSTAIHASPIEFDDIDLKSTHYKEHSDTGMIKDE